MAEWIPPKTKWLVEDVPGLGDFERIEGNAEYLKEQTDGLKNGSIKAGDAKLINGLPIYARIVPSDTVILSAPADRRAQGHDETVVKRFRLKYPGVYRVKAQMHGGGSSYTAYALFYVGDALFVGEMKANSWGYAPVSRDIVVPGWELTLTIKIRNSNISQYTYIRNVQVCGTLTTAEPANPAVLQN